MVCEESTRELRKKQEQLKSRTLWLQEMKQAIIKKTRLTIGSPLEILAFFSGTGGRKSIPS